MFGIVTASVPSFAVAATIVDHVVPPFVDNKISTFAQLTPFAVVPATAQVMVCVLPPT